jgi:hypothetical protein
MMTAARVGEQMKCKAVERKRGVSVRSRGVIRIRGVRYRKLVRHEKRRRKKAKDEEAGVRVTGDGDRIRNARG